MKLMELLEQGKKATREGLEELYVESLGDIIIDKNKFRYYVTLEDMRRNDWYEYEEYKTNFEFKKGDMYYSSNARGYIHPLRYENLGTENDTIKNFNAFPNKELAEFIQKKQLLERKLMVFSYLNGASEIDWNEDDRKYHIECIGNDELGTCIDAGYTLYESSACYIYFKDEKTCKKALELYGNEIKEVMEMKIKLGL